MFGPVKKRRNSLMNEIVKQCFAGIRIRPFIIVFMLYGNLGVCAQILSDLGNLIGNYLDQEQSKLLSFVRNDLYSFKRAQHVLSYHLIEVPWLILCSSRI